MKPALMLKTLTASTALLITTSLTAAPIAPGTVIGVDFGPTAPATTTNFNQVSTTSNGSLAAGTLTDTSDVAVDNVGFSWSANNPWFNNADSLSYPAQPAVFDDSHTTDWLGISSATATPNGIITLLSPISMTH